MAYNWARNRCNTKQAGGNNIAFCNFLFNHICSAHTPSNVVNLLRLIHPPPSPLIGSQCCSASTPKTVAHVGERCLSCLAYMKLLTFSSE
ncbi:unnamed protein product [Ixodes persulcatus]